MNSNTERIEPKLPTLSPPQKLAYSSKRTRSKTNFQMQAQQKQSQPNPNENREGNLKQDSKPKLRKYSQSFAVLKANTYTTSTKDTKLGKMDSKEYASSNSKISHNKNSKSLIDHKNKNNGASQRNSEFRSKIFSTHLLHAHQLKQTKANPYDKFVKQLNIRLPTPQQKFKQFLQIPPFNRLKNHTDFISHMLHKSSPFFHMHPSQIIDNVAKKIILIDPEEMPQNFLIILDEGQCYYNSKKIEKGCLLTRNKFQKELFAYDCDGHASFIGLPHHQYSAFVSQYLNSNMERFRKFMESIQIFKIFTQPAMEKIYSSLTLSFYSKGEMLYEPGQLADTLYLIYSGSAARKIIVQIDKTNKIPIQKYSKLVKVLSRSYEHRIRFNQQDLVGVADIIDNITKRSEDIIVDEDTTILAIDRTAIEENLDEYIVDRLRKYNLRKYPKNYDQLCENYLKEKIENRKAEERKISALKDSICRDSHNQRKNQKITNIIKIYQERIRIQEKEHLIDRKKMQRIVQSDS